jgi:hypothetical protein
MNKTLFALVTATGLAGCALLDLATQKRPNTAQSNAIGDLFDQTATIATTFDDPAAANAGDLVAMVSFDHFVFLIEPSFAPGGAAAARMLPASALECLVDDGEGTLTATACAVVLEDGRACVVDGSIAREADGDGNRYHGSASLSGEGCPASTVAVDVTLVGPSDSPTQLTGSLAVSTDDGDTSFTGTADFDVAGTGSCEVPSTGTIDVSVTGTYRGDAIDGGLTLVFHDSPDCGYISIE